MVAYNTGSDPIEFGDLGSKVKVTVTENVCKKWWKMMKKIRQKFKSRYFWNQILRLEIWLPSFWYQIWPYCTINNSKNYQWKFLKKYFWLKIFCEDANSHKRPSFVFCVIAITNCAIEACESTTQLCNIYYNFCTN